MKWIGALLLLIATTWVGFELANQLNNRPKQIRQLKNALQIVEAEIVYSQAPLEEAFRIVAKQIPNPIASFFQAISQELLQQTADLPTIWEEEIARFFPNLALGNDEKELMQQFGRTLGQHDITQQKKHIQLAFTHLDRALEEAQDNQQRYGRMVKSLGFLTGLFIVLLLL
ncbi:stage III sporulation protein SpoIIIAB [Paraliobacillus quinghaiensis]|uniref:stage III sporulation protein SpoIIIAB n=1 Tax=Paraliobacillus quinghaiensis TaxID=470815 RepID=UPI000E3DCA29|nr:stage III sporulation protein SpoIIIAB [Paraliobacillus quinghaiensis]